MGEGRAYQTVQTGTCEAKGPSAPCGGGGFFKSAQNLILLFNSSLNNQRSMWWRRFSKQYYYYPKLLLLLLLNYYSKPTFTFQFKFKQRSMWWRRYNKSDPKLNLKFKSRFRFILPTRVDNTQTCGSKSTNLFPWNIWTATHGIMMQVENGKRVELSVDDFQFPSCCSCHLNLWTEITQIQMSSMKLVRLLLKMQWLSIPASSCNLSYPENSNQDVFQ